MNTFLRSFLAAALCVVAILVSALAPPAQAATNDLTVGDPGAGYSYRDTAYFYAPESVLDLSTTATTSNDVAVLLNVTAGSYVYGLTYHVETAVTNASITFDVGDSASDTTWISGASATNTGWGGSALAATSASTSTSFPAVVTTTLAGGGKFYAADDTIRVTFNLNPGDTGKIRIKPHLSFSPDRD